jgi:putative endonuclease
VLRGAGQVNRVCPREGPVSRAIRSLLISVGERLDDLRHKRHVKSKIPVALTQGMRGEDLAHRYLQRKGFRVVARNWRTRNQRGEADLICWDREQIVFVEVKTRATAEYGEPEQAVDERKRRMLRWAASEYVYRAEIALEAVRFDVVSVVLHPRLEIVHHVDAFDPIRSRSATAPS